MRLLRILALLCWMPLAQAQVLPYTDVNSTNTIALTNKTIDCSLNTCVNVPAGASTTLSNTATLTLPGGASPSTCVPGSFYICIYGVLGGSLTTGQWGPIRLYLNSTSFSHTGAATPVLSIENHFSGSGIVANMWGLKAGTYMEGTTGNLGGGLSSNYVGGTFEAKANANDGGAGSGSGNSRGALWGLDTVVALQTGATFWHNLFGAEMDIEADTSSSIDNVYGYITYLNSGHAVDGTFQTAAYALAASNNADPRFTQGISFGSYDGRWPMDATGTMIGTYNHANAGGSAGTTTNGIDFSNVTFTGNAYKSNGFAVDGNGIIGNSTAGGNVVVGGVSATYNSFTFNPSTTGQPIVLSASGVDTNISFAVQSKGTGTASFGNSSNNILTANADGGVGGGSVWGFHTTASGNNLAYVSVGGSDTNISMSLRPKGTGVLEIIAPLDLRDTSAAFDVDVVATSSTALTAKRTLTLDMNNVAHTLAFNATANTITFPNTSSYTLIGSGDTGTVTNTMLAGSITLTNLATQATNTVLGNATSGSATPTALSVGGCSSSTSALIWTTNTGFGCNTSINAATLGGATFSAPGAIGGGTAAAGNFTTLGTSALMSPALGITVTGGDTNIEASDNHNTNINTGTSTGTVTLGQNSATPGAVAIKGPVSFQAGTATSTASWGSTSPVWNGVAMTLNDTTASGPVTRDVAYSIQAPTFTSTGGASTTITNATSLFVTAPVCSGGVVCTNTFGIESSGKIRGMAGLTVDSATVNINVSSNQVTNINTGSSNAAIHIGDGSGNNTIGIGNGTGVVTGASPWTFSNATIKMTAITTGTNADTVCLKADGTLLIQAAACTISSLRFKEDVKDVQDSTIPEISSMRVASFRMKDGKSNVDPNAASTQTGLIAENIAKVAPECAIYENDMKTPKSYRQECVIALLVRGEQELVKQNAMLKAELRKLEAR